METVMRFCPRLSILNVFNLRIASKRFKFCPMKKAHIIMGAIITTGSAFAADYSGDIYWTSAKNLVRLDDKTAYSADINGKLAPVTEADGIDWAASDLIFDATKTGEKVNAFNGPLKAMTVKNFIVNGSWTNAQGKDQYLWFAESESGAPLKVEDTLSIESRTLGRVNGSYGLEAGKIVVVNRNKHDIRVALGGEVMTSGTSGFSYVDVNGNFDIAGNIFLLTNSKNAIGSKNAGTFENPEFAIGGAMTMRPVENLTPTWEMQFFNSNISDGVARHFTRLAGLRGVGKIAVSKSMGEKAESTYIFTTPKGASADFNGKMVYYADHNSVRMNFAMLGEGEQILRIGKGSVWKGSITVDKGIFRAMIPGGANVAVDVVINAGRFGGVGENGDAGRIFAESLKWNGGAVYAKTEDGLTSSVFVRKPIELAQNAAAVFALDTDENLEGKWTGSMLEWDSDADAQNRETFENAAKRKAVKLFVNGKEHEIREINLNDGELNILVGKKK